MQLPSSLRVRKKERGRGIGAELLPGPESNNDRNQSSHFIKITKIFCCQQQPFYDALGCHLSVIAFEYLSDLLYVYFSIKVGVCVCAGVRVCVCRRLLCYCHRFALVESRKCRYILANQSYAFGLREREMESEWEREGERQRKRLTLAACFMTHRGIDPEKLLTLQ